MKYIPSFAVFAAMAFVCPAFADQSLITVENAVMRAPRGDTGMTALYMDLTNHSGFDDTLTAVELPGAKTVALHETTTDENGVMSMHDLPDGVPLPAGKTVQLTPKHMHLMVTGLQDAPASGHLAAILTFAHAAPETVDVEIIQPLK